MCLSPLCCFPSFVSCCCLDRRGLAGDRNKWVRWETSVIRWHKAIIKEQLHAWASVCVVVVVVAVCAGACIILYVRSVVGNLRVVRLCFFCRESSTLCSCVFVACLSGCAISLFVGSDWDQITFQDLNFFFSYSRRRLDSFWEISPLSSGRDFSNLFNNNLFIAPRYWPKYIVLKHNVSYVSSTLQLSNKNLKQTCWSLQTVSNFWSENWEFLPQECKW